MVDKIPKFILICATGRSGSTTLQRIVNTIPFSNICGENSGSINVLLDFYERLKTALKYSIKNDKNELMGYPEIVEKNIKPAWYNCFDIDAIRNDIRGIIIKMFDDGNNPKVIGFKEIRYSGNIKKIDTFIELFPNTKIICHIRNDLDSQSQSSWWKENKNSKACLENYNRELINFAKDRDSCYLSTFENMFDIRQMAKLFKFLNEPLNVQQYRNIISNNLK